MAHRTCPTCGEPFDGQHDHACTMTDDEMRRYALNFVATRTRLADKLKGDISITELAEWAAGAIGTARAGNYAPHRPSVECKPDAIYYRRDISTSLFFRMTWREAISEIRAGATQLSLF